MSLREKDCLGQISYKDSEKKANISIPLLKNKKIIRKGENTIKYHNMKKDNGFLCFSAFNAL